MKTQMKELFTNLGFASRSRVLTTLIAGLGLMLATSAPAQTFTNLHTFTGGGPSYGEGLTVSGKTLYGTADSGGGSSSSGTVFKVNIDGTGFTNLYSFTATSGSFPNPYTNSDGASPNGGLILLANTLYGTAEGGGISGDGTVFKVNTDGTGFATLHTFTATSLPDSTAGTNSDGSNPFAGLVLSGDTLYGTTAFGGISGAGTVFEINTDGTGFTNLHSFAAATGFYPDYTNSDGAIPSGGLILSGNTLYGTAPSGGSSAHGTVFALNTDGTSFATLHTFSTTSGSEGYYGTNSDGGGPYDKLILSGNTLFGTTADGGTSGTGTVFAVNTNGTDFTTLYYFTATSLNSPFTNSDGAYPHGLILSGYTLYGTAAAGGPSGDGTVFALTTNGTGFTTLYNFAPKSGLNANSDGAYSVAALILSGNALYGTAQGGGTTGDGTVFRITLPAPQLTITASDTNVVMTWPTNYAGFDYTGYTLLSTTNLALPAVWATNAAAPVVVNGQFTVTNPISGTQQFYQLSQ
jgi:uncharacterized repeat protein (TIGR03803 family)